MIPRVACCGEECLSVRVLARLRGGDIGRCDSQFLGVDRARKWPSALRRIIRHRLFAQQQAPAAPFEICCGRTTRIVLRADLPARSAPLQVRRHRPSWRRIGPQKARLPESARRFLMTAFNVSLCSRKITAAAQPRNAASVETQIAPPRQILGLADIQSFRHEESLPVIERDRTKSEHSVLRFATRCPGEPAAARQDRFQGSRRNVWSKCLLGGKPPCRACRKLPLRWLLQTDRRRSRVHWPSGALLGKARDIRPDTTGQESPSAGLESESLPRHRRDRQPASRRRTRERPQSLHSEDHAQEIQALSSREAK